MATFVKSFLVTILAASAYAEYYGSLEPLPGRTRASTNLWISTARADFSTAYNYCIASGGRLLAMKNHVVEQDVQTRLLARGILSVPIWLSSYVDPTTNVWKWGDGTSIGLYRNFAPGYGVNTVQSSSALMMNPYYTLDATASFKWQPDFIYNENLFICEY